MRLLANDNIQSHAAQRGVWRVFRQTAAALAERFGPAVELCSPRPYPELAARWRPIPHLPGALGARATRLLRLHDAMVSLVALGERPAAIYSAYYGAVRARAPQAYTVYDMIVERFPEHFPRSNFRVRRLLAEKRRCFERAALLLAISAATARDLRAACPQLDPARIVVIPLGVEEVFFSPPAPPDAARPYFLFAGSRGLYKNFLGLLEAYGRSGLAGAYDLRAFSPGPAAFTAEERALIGRHGLAGRVLLTASPSDERARDLYAGAAALVYPSRYEGFGLPVLEAMACGAVVVASDTSSLPEVGGDAALYVDPGSPDAIAAAMARVAGLSADERAAIVALGRARAGLFTWGRYRARVGAAFEGLVGRTPGNAEKG